MQRKKHSYFKFCENKTCCMSCMNWNNTVFQNWGKICSKTTTCFLFFFCCGYSKKLHVAFLLQKCFFLATLLYVCFCVQVVCCFVLICSMCCKVWFLLLNYSKDFWSNILGQVNLLLTFDYSACMKLSDCILIDCTHFILCNKFFVRCICKYMLLTGLAQVAEYFWKYT